MAALRFATGDEDFERSAHAKEPDEGVGRGPGGPPHLAAVAEAPEFEEIALQFSRDPCAFVWWGFNLEAGRVMYLSTHVYRPGKGGAPDP